MRHIAGALFRGERPESVLQPTGLVNEFYLRLVRRLRLSFEDRNHLFSVNCHSVEQRLLGFFERLDRHIPRDWEPAPRPQTPDSSFLPWPPFKTILFDSNTKWLAGLEFQTR